MYICWWLLCPRKQKYMCLEDISIKSDLFNVILFILFAIWKTAPTENFIFNFSIFENFIDTKESYFACSSLMRHFVCWGRCDNWWEQIDKIERRTANLLSCGCYWSLSRPLPVFNLIWKKEKFYDHGWWVFFSPRAIHLNMVDTPNLSSVKMNFSMVLLLGPQLWSYNSVCGKCCPPLPVYICTLLYANGRVVVLKPYTFLIMYSRFRVIM